MGFQMNMAESSAIIASVDVDGNKQMSIDEFIDLIFSDNQVIAPPDKAMTHEERVEQLRQEAMETKREKTRTQYKFYIQKSLNNAALDMLALDRE